MKPVLVQPVAATIQHLPTPFNQREYDTLAALNLPCNSSGSVAPNEVATISLGYRMVIPRGCIGMIKERRSVVQKTPFYVLAGILDCNTIHDDTNLQRNIALPNDYKTDTVTEITRFHPELVLFLRNIGIAPLEYKPGDCLVQLFLLPVLESQVLRLDTHSTDGAPIPLRQSSTQSLSASSK